MNRIDFHTRKGVLLAALLIVSCSQGPTAPTTSLTAAAKGADSGGIVQGSAVGDVKTGPVDMDMNLVRVDQTDGVQAFYANPGGEYIVRPGRQVEIYVQIWTSNPAVTTPPRVIVDWGIGEKDNIHCGPCRLSRTYATEGKYTVTVTLDDRVSSFTTRTFTLNVTPETNRSGFGTFNGDLSAGDPLFDRYDDDDFAPPTPSPGCTTDGGQFHYDTYLIRHPGGPLRIETTAANFSGSDDTYLNVFAGSFNPANACQNIVASDDDGGGGVFLSRIQANFPAGDYVVVVTTYSALRTGSYTLVIE